MPFEWEDIETTENFFEEVNNNVVEEVQDVEKPTEESVTETIVEEDLFKDDIVNEEPVITDNIKTLNYLKEKGLIDFEVEEELTEELAEDLLISSYENAIEEKVAEKIENIPEEGKQLMLYLLKGGNLGEYLSTINKTTSTMITHDMDITDEKNQEIIVREALKAEGEDDEFIETQIELLKDSGRLKSYSENRYNKWLEKDKKLKQKLLQEQKERVKEERLVFDSYVKTVKEDVGIPLSKKDKEIIPSYINQKTIKLENGSSITELQKDLFYELPKNKKAMIQLAVLMKNRNEDGTFNFESIAENIKTKITKEIKNNMRRNKPTLPTTSTGRTNGTKRLADYFE